jgi:uncharacterized protein
MAAEMTRDDLIHKLFAMIDEGNSWEKLAEFFAPHAIYFRPGYSPMEGIAAIQSFYASARQVSSGKHQIHEILSDGPRCCCWGEFSGQTKSQDSIVLQFTDWYRFSGSLIAYRRTFFYQPMI